MQETEVHKDDGAISSGSRIISFRVYPGEDNSLAKLRITIGLISRLLEYPNEEILNDLISQEDKLEQIVPSSEVRSRIIGFLKKVRKESLSNLRTRYVSLFDFSDKTTLNLTYLLFGEERDRTQKAQRGSALLLLKSLYSEAGFEPDNVELADYLPMALEFVAIAPRDQGVKVAKLIREPARVLEKNLEQLATEGGGYALLLDACNSALEQFVSGGEESGKMNFTGDLAT